ncbi:hypothetical protein JTB14_011953 [Gonioctena quinquepunctata]|nr:hypothetical protein JTB14_011953 [Gonioctena quinquepunctata]
MASSDEDDELLREKGQLSDIDVHLEQGDSDSEEDSSDEDDTDVKQETQDEVANSRSEIVLHQGPVGGIQEQKHSHIQHI